MNRVLHIYLIFYVKDIILTPSSHSLISKVISQLSFEFPMSDLGYRSLLFGIISSRSALNLFLSQNFFAR